MWQIIYTILMPICIYIYFFFLHIYHLYENTFSVALILISTEIGNVLFKENLQRK